MKFALHFDTKIQLRQEDVNGYTAVLLTFNLGQLTWGVLDREV